MQKTNRSNFRIPNHFLAASLQRGEEQRKAMLANLQPRKTNKR